MKYPDIFLRAFAYLMNNEGYYSDDPNDAGGKTKYGISERFLRNSFKNGSLNVDLNNDGKIDDKDIYVMNVEHAKHIYYLEFWKRVEKIKHPELSIKVFDTAVNIGAKKAIKILQQIVGTIQDGIIGDQTISAIESQNANKILQDYCNEQALYYYKVAFYNKPRSDKFLKGWLNRAKKLP